MSASEAAVAELPNKSVFFSRKTIEWATPDWLYAQLNDMHGFTLDVCANKGNAKCERFFSAEQDGLKQDWSGEICWMNPPYGRQIQHWVAKAVQESKRAKIVCLLPARTDTKWFHDLVLPHKKAINFLRGRLRFDDQGGNPPNNAPFPSIVVVFDARAESVQIGSSSERLETEGGQGS